MATDGPNELVLYDSQVDRASPLPVRLLFAVLGGLFLFTYFRNIASVVSDDIHNFPMAFREGAVLTLAFAFGKLLVYFLFPYLAATWVYAPFRDLWATKIEGQILGVESIPAGQGVTWWSAIPLLSWFLSWGMPVPGRSNMKMINMSNGYFRVPDAPGLTEVLSGEAWIGRQVVLTLGAFNRVLSIKLVSETPLTTN